MAKVRGPLFSVEAAGAFGDQLLFRRGPAGVRVSRPGVAPKAVRKKATAAQAEQRGYFKQAVDEWNAMDDAGRAAVHAEARALGLPMNGYSLWLKRRIAELSIPFELDVEFLATNETGTTGELQRFTIPRDGRYRLTAFGAQGGAADGGQVFGLGAKMSGEFDLLAGTELVILVGQAGHTRGSNRYASGGGATMVMAHSPVPFDIGTRGAVINVSSSLPSQTAINLARLESIGHQITIVDKADVETYDFSGFDYIFVSYKPNTFSDFSGSERIASLPIHIISENRYFSQYAMDMSDNSDRTSTEKLELESEFHPLYSFIESRETKFFGSGSSVYGFVLEDLKPGTFPGLNSLGRSDYIVWADRMENGFLRRHLGIRDWEDGAPDDRELFDRAFVQRAPSVEDVLLIAGGGGGVGYSSAPTPELLEKAHGHTEGRGQDGYGSEYFGAGGEPGFGGARSDSGFSRAGGGGGLWTKSYGNQSGDALIYGGEGGVPYWSYAYGGFGGGGTINDGGGGYGCGGGGGYGGGGGGREATLNAEAYGGGGGSFNRGENQDNESGVREGAGFFRLEAV